MLQWKKVPYQDDTFVVTVGLFHMILNKPSPNDQRWYFRCHNLEIARYLQATFVIDAQNEAADLVASILKEYLTQLMPRN
jgi:hypothetical protein